MFTEYELVDEIKKRNKTAYEFLVQNYTKPIYYLAHSILRTGCAKEDIEECVADVFLDAWIKIDEFDAAKGSLKTWLFVLTKYKALAYRRKFAKQSAVVDIADYPIPGATDIERQLIEREQQEKIIATIDAFNPTDRALFIRRYFLGEKISDLMDALGLSRSAVDNRLLRGRKIIKEVLSHE